MKSSPNRWGHLVSVVNLPAKLLPMAKPDFRPLIQTRKNILNILSGYSVEALNEIPEGFNNNLAWHLGHLVVTQQLICYKNAGLEMLVPDEWVEQFKKGTKPESKVSADQIEALKAALVELPKRTEGDYDKGIFKTYERYETSFGLVLETPEGAINFNNVHEGLHLGYIMAQRRFLTL